MASTTASPAAKPAVISFRSRDRVLTFSFQFPALGIGSSANLPCTASVTPESYGVVFSSKGDGYVVDLIVAGGWSRSACLFRGRRGNWFWAHRFTRYHAWVGYGHHGA